jgi:hypothetical protein
MRLPMTVVYDACVLFPTTSRPAEAAPTGRNCVYRRIAQTEFAHNRC